jgi:hypothetical protein
MYLDSSDNTLPGDQDLVGYADGTAVRAGILHNQPGRPGTSSASASAPPGTSSQSAFRAPVLVDEFAMGTQPGVVQTAPLVTFLARPEPLEDEENVGAGPISSIVLSPTKYPSPVKPSLSEMSDLELAGKYLYTHVTRDVSPHICTLFLQYLIRAIGRDNNWLNPKYSCDVKITRTVFILKNSRNNLDPTLTCLIPKIVPGTIPVAYFCSPRIDESETVSFV